MKEFFGWDGYAREPEGYMSWQHLVFVTSLMILMIAMAIWLGRKYAKREEKDKNKVLICSAFLIDGLEIFKITICGLRSDDPLFWTTLLPLFLCSIQLITIPLAAFCTGRVKEAALDFVLIFGVLGAVLGTYAAGQNYAAYPVLSFDNVISGLTHSISGFVSLYIAFSGLVSMKKRNIFVTFAILGFFCVAAYLANHLLPGGYNYMFLMRGDGTPYDILYNLFGGNPVLYPLSVVLLFLLYIAAFYQIYYLIQKKCTQK